MKGVALMSDAGFRPNEIRALRWENGEPVGGCVVVCEGSFTNMNIGRISDALLHRHR